MIVGRGYYGIAAMGVATAAREMGILPGGREILTVAALPQDDKWIVVRAANRS